MPLYDEAWIMWDYGSSWTKRLLKKGFGHIAVVINVNNQFYLFNPLQEGLNFQKLEMNKPSLLMFMRQKFKCIHIVFNKKRNFNFLSVIGFFTCTQFVKYVLGIKIRGFTPYRFFKTLAKMNENKEYPYFVREINLLK